jgi:hypothetical protein
VCAHGLGGVVGVAVLAAARARGERQQPRRVRGDQAAADVRGAPLLAALARRPARDEAVLLERGERARVHVDRPGVVRGDALVRGAQEGSLHRAAELVEVLRGTHERTTERTIALQMSAADPDGSDRRVGYRRSCGPRPRAHYG